MHFDRKQLFRQLCSKSLFSDIQTDSISCGDTEYQNNLHIMACGGFTADKSGVLGPVQEEAMSLGSETYNEMDMNAFSQVCEQLESVKLESATDSNNTAQSMERASDVDVGNSEMMERIFRQDNDGDTLLHVAIIMQLYDIAMSFLHLTTNSCFLNIPNHLFQTPLHLAVITKHTDLVRRLLVGGAEVDRQDREGNTALHVACRNGSTTIVKALITPVSFQEVSNINYNPPYQTIPQNLEIRNYEGQTCLHLAAVNGHVDILNILLDCGADVNARESKSGRTVCHLAVETENHVLLGHILRQTKTDVNIKTYNGVAPIDFAREKGDYIGFEKLVAAGALLQNEEE